MIKKTVQQICPRPRLGLKEQKVKFIQKKKRAYLIYNNPPIQESTTFSGEESMRRLYNKT